MMDKYSIVRKMRYPVALVSLLSSLYGCRLNKDSVVPTSDNKTASDNHTAIQTVVYLNPDQMDSQLANKINSGCSCFQLIKIDGFGIDNKPPCSDNNSNNNFISYIVDKKEKLPNFGIQTIYEYPENTFYDVVMRGRDADRDGFPDDTTLFIFYPQGYKISDNVTNAIVQYNKSPIGEFNKISLMGPTDNQTFNLDIANDLIEVHNPRIVFENFELYKDFQPCQVLRCNDSKRLKFGAKGCSDNYTMEAYINGKLFQREKNKLILDLDYLNLSEGINKIEIIATDPETELTSILYMGIEYGPCQPNFGGPPIVTPPSGPPIVTPPCSGEGSPPLGATPL